MRGGRESAEFADAIPVACAAARRRLNERADAALDAAGRAELEAHLVTCPECRSAADGLSSLREALGALPRMALPDADLEAVWERTVDAPRGDRGGRRLRWVLARCAAAALAAAGIAVGLQRSALRSAPVPRETELSAAELVRAQAELRFVSQTAERALRQAERTAVEAALAQGMRPALRRVPVLRKNFPDASTRRN